MFSASFLGDYSITILCFPLGLHGSLIVTASLMDSVMCFLLDISGKIASVNRTPLATERSMITKINRLSFKTLCPEVVQRQNLVGSGFVTTRVHFVNVRRDQSFHCSLPSVKNADVIVTWTDFKLGMPMCLAFALFHHYSEVSCTGVRAQFIVAAPLFDDDSK